MTTTSTTAVQTVPWTKVDEYIITYPTASAPPRIQLVQASGEISFELRFLREESEPPTDTATVGYYRIGDFARILDLLRNEQPIYYVFNGPTPANTNGFQTGGKVGPDRAQN
jgi:hypothetical protein